MSYVTMTSERQKVLKYIKVARYNADIFSKDPKTKVGCFILTHDFGRILSTGINGMPRNMNDNRADRWENPTKLTYVCHAEANAVANAARSGTPIENAIVVVTKFPCSTCAKLLIQAGICKVYSIKPDYDSATWGKDSQISEEMFREVGIDVSTYSQEEVDSV